MEREVLLTVDGVQRPEDRSVAVARCYNLGFTIRDPARMQRHLDELQGIAVASPRRPPLIIPVGSWLLTTEDQITVQSDRTSGEVEIVVIETEDDILVGVGSDHTDRALEEKDIPGSKQAAPNVLAPVVWRWSDVEDHWDDVEIESYTADTSKSEFRLYQRGTAGDFWTPAQIIESVKERIVALPGARVFYCGTLPTEDGELRYERTFKMRLHDPARARTIEHVYSVTVLGHEISD